MSAIISRHFFTGDDILGSLNFLRNISAEKHEESIEQLHLRNRKSDDDIAREFSILIPLENSFRRGRTGADNLFKLSVVVGAQAAAGTGRGAEARFYFRQGSRAR